MELVRFDDVEQFYQQVLPFLAAKEAHNNLPLGILSTLRMDALYFGDPPYLALVRRDGKIVAVALRTPPHNPCLSWTDDRDAVGVILADMHRVYETLPGVLGPSEVARVFADQWQALTGQRERVEIAERIYQLTSVHPVSGVEGYLRRSTPAERELMVEWWMAFAAEAVSPVERSAAEKAVDRSLDGKARRLFVWDVDGTAVSLSGCTGETPNGIRIGPVYTPPELRGRGYASACVAALSQLLLDEGRKYCFLFTDLGNPTSNHIYQAIGYEPVCDVDMYAFDDGG